MNSLTGLDPSFADGNVALGVVLGGLGACATVRACLPAPAVVPNATRAPASSAVAADAPIDPFLALLLGAVVTHERLTSIVAATGHVVDGARATAASPHIGGLLR